MFPGDGFCLSIYTKTALSVPIHIFGLVAAANRRADWPQVDGTDDNCDVCLVINYSINDIINGIGLADEQIRARIGCGRKRLRAVYRKWAAGRGWKHKGVR